MSETEMAQFESEAAEFHTTTQVTHETFVVESSTGVDAEIEDMKRRVKEMEEEAAKLSEMQSQVESQMGKNTASSLNELNASASGSSGHAIGSNSNTSTNPNGGSSTALDDSSVYVGQVDYGSTPEELQALFQSCGTINRVTILCDKFTGQPKGYAYIEFASKDAVESALLLNDTMFRGRQLKVTPKRQNVRGFNYTRGGRGSMRGRMSGRGRGGRGRVMGRIGFRGRGRGFHPYY
uniref:Polyadenylatebinding protein 2 putative n=1 Tax=Albugo laibachii Nc14 TaxID=890382 RepID=F0WJR7_9STRA|nr:polyadenylatebinding protein 2 putative [Albugo laibachii Nc14]|eukprot:CCA21518.1 polyadenylatebinding protein 2 putative [Albugo laibachii Nc14]